MTPHDMSRRSGVLLHVTSIPGPDGIGDLGACSRELVAWLGRAGQRLWQTLPLHPPASDVMSPYDAVSAFALHPLLTGLDDLVDLGLLTADTVARARHQHAVTPAHGAPMLAGRAGGFDPLAHVRAWKQPLLDQAAQALLALPSGHELRRELDAFGEREAVWLTDLVQFTQLAEQHAGRARTEWPITDRARREPMELEQALAHPAAAAQLLVERQLRQLRVVAAEHDVWLMGDAPIYVGEDSVDVWGNPELFLLDDEQRARVRTGAPPDAMDPGGQVWAMPAYDWDANKQHGYAWWLRRLAREQELADIVRIDHFRAFADWWSVPRDAPSDAGHWKLGPGSAFFEHVRRELGDVNLIVEDLGANTEPLERLREETGLPQMRVLVEGLSAGPGSDSPHLPDAWSGDEAAYTDTHDYDTVAGWAATASPEQLAFAHELTGATSAAELPRAAIELVAHSRARLAITPLQDWLELGSDDRMNVPGTADGNWRWIAPADAFSDELADTMHSIARAADRTEERG